MCHILGCTSKWYHMVFVFFFSFWLTSLRLTIYRYIRVAANGIISFFLSGWVVFHCPHLYPFLCWWTFRLSPCTGIVNSRKLIVFIKDGHFFCIYILWSHICNICILFSGTHKPVEDNRYFYLILSFAGIISENVLPSLIENFHSN